LRDVLLHIPHASVAIPEEWREAFLLSSEDLDCELLRMTDRYTDDLFQCDNADRLEFPVSRLLVDPERFERDEDEVMANRGMGAVYVKTSDGRPLKSALGREELMDAFYRPHHRQLSEWTANAIEQYGRALIVDCHSYPDNPLPSDIDQSPGRPDFCIGTAGEHTPDWVTDVVQSALERLGHSVTIDRPYAGAIVPIDRYGADYRVRSVMIEINRKLYMDEATGAKNPGYAKTRESMRIVLAELASAWHDR